MSGDLLAYSAAYVVANGTAVSGVYARPPRHAADWDAHDAATKCSDVTRCTGPPRGAGYRQICAPASRGRRMRTRSTPPSTPDTSPFPVRVRRAARSPQRRARPAAEPSARHEGRRSRRPLSPMPPDPPPRITGRGRDHSLAVVWLASIHKPRSAAGTVPDPVTATSSSLRRRSFVPNHLGEHLCANHRAAQQPGQHEVEVLTSPIGCTKGKTRSRSGTRRIWRTATSRRRWRSGTSISDSRRARSEQRATAAARPGEPPGATWRSSQESALEHQRRSW